jgi:hypothetical protein
LNKWALLIVETNCHLRSQAVELNSTACLWQ